MVDKASVHYRPSTDPAKRCGVCTMFRPPHGCTLVRGEIDRSYVCDKFAPKHNEAIKRRMT